MIVINLALLLVGFMGGLVFAGWAFALLLMRSHMKLVNDMMLVGGMPFPSFVIIEDVSDEQT